MRAKGYVGKALAQGRCPIMRKEVGGSAAITARHLRAVETLVNVVLRLEPSACTVAIIATEIPAAIRPYSMAVAPVWSRKNLTNVLILPAASVIGVILTRALLRHRRCGCVKKKEAMVRNWQPNRPFWTFESPLMGERAGSRIDLPHPAAEN